MLTRLRRKRAAPHEAGRYSHHTEHHSETPPLQTPWPQSLDLAIPHEERLTGRGSNKQWLRMHSVPAGGRRQGPNPRDVARMRSSGGDLHDSSHREQSGQAEGGRAGREGAGGGGTPAAAVGRPEATGDDGEGR
ncbi:hypothetical protein VPH35_105228 [Triticum aestivum]